MRFAYYLSWYDGSCTALYIELHARLVAFGLFKRVEIKYVYTKKKKKVQTTEAEILLPRWRSFQIFFHNP